MTSEFTSHGAAVVSSGPVYIGGLDRSGKTTMRAFLASHSNIAIPAVGSNMWTYFYRRYGDLAVAENLESCLHAMLRYKHVRFLDPDPERIRREFAAGDPTYARLFSLFLIHFAEREGKPRWGAQTGLIERYAGEMFAAYPGLKIIHMVRDPRDRYEASLAKWPDGRLQAGGATARFLYSTGLAGRNVRRHPRDYLVIRFEDLVNEPERTIRQVCEFIGEDFEPAMLALGAAPKLKAQLEDGIDDAPDGVPLSATFIGRFAGRIPTHELAFMQTNARRRMRRYGYHEVPVLLTPSAWIRYIAIQWPSQFVRMATWLAIEFGQQRFPRVIPRRFGRRMLVESTPEAV